MWMGCQVSMLGEMLGQMTMQMLTVDLPSSGKVVYWLIFDKPVTDNLAAIFDLFPVSHFQ